MAETHSRGSGTSPTWAQGVYTGWRNISRLAGPTFHTLTATMARGFWRLPACSICWPHCTPMKPRGAGKLEPDEVSPKPLASDAAVCAHDLHCVWFPQPAPPARSREIYCMVAAAISAVRHRDRLGYVPVFALTTLQQQRARKHSFL